MLSCYLRNETPFFFWTGYLKTYIILSFIELYSLCSSLNFSDENLVKPDTNQVLEDGQQGI